MGNGVFNVAKGRVNELLRRVDENDPSGSVIVLTLIKSGCETDSVLEDYDTLAAILAAANTEADFTNYATGGVHGKALSDTEISAPTPDDTNNWIQGFFPDTTWSSAGGTTNNTLAKLIVGYDPTSGGTNSSLIIPLTHHDFSITTNGGDLTADVGANGFYKAS